jgi:hypothetical protein
MKKVLLSAVFIAISVCSFAQVGISTKTPNADSDLTLGAIDKGLLLNRVALASTTAITPLSAHVAGMIVYNTATAGDVTPGYYINDGSKWARIIDASTSVTDAIVFNAEYAGAALEADGANNLGLLTSNNTGGTSWMNYYSWSNTQNAGGNNDYDVILRFKLPANFTAWSANAIEIAHAGTSDANFTATVYAEGSATAQATLGATTSSNIATWATASIPNTGLTLAAGNTGIIVLHMTAADTAAPSGSEIRLGDITLNFTRSN